MNEKIVLKKYCIDFDSDIEIIEAKIDKNKIICESFADSFYKIYIWQQLLINKILDNYDLAILEINYVDIDFVKTIEIKKKFEISKERRISGQCLYCNNRVECKKFQNALVDDFIIEINTPDKLYNTYVIVNAKIETLDKIQKELRENINELIKKNNNKLILNNLGLTLTIKEIFKDEFPFDIALKNNLLNENNCKIKITEFKKTIKNTDFTKYLKKVLFQKRLNIE